MLDLTNPTGFAGKINGFAATDAIDFVGAWSLLKVQQNSAHSQTTLTLSNGTARSATGSP